MAYKRTAESLKKREATIIERYGSVEAFNKKLAEFGAKGGKAEKTKPSGFAANPALASRAGRKGGRISRRRARENA